MIKNEHDAVLVWYINDCRKVVLVRGWPSREGWRRGVVLSSKVAGLRRSRMISNLLVHKTLTSVFPLILTNSTMAVEVLHGFRRRTHTQGSTVSTPGFQYHLEMVNFVPNKVYLRAILLHCFVQGKTLADAHDVLVDTYGEYALSKSACRNWYRRFSENDFVLTDRGRSGAPRKFHNAQLEEVLTHDRGQTLGELGEALNVKHSTVSRRLRELKMVQREGHWVPFRVKRKEN